MESLDQTEKKCPFCAELIKQEAIVCRYCSRDLPARNFDFPIDEKVTCERCSTRMLRSTADRYNGLCALCAKKNGILPQIKFDLPIDEKVTCGRCSTRMLRSTANKYNGLCALCAKKNGILPQRKSARNNSVPACPKCQSTAITYNKKGFSAGKALLGAVAFAGVGLLAGFSGSNKIRATCVNCGNSWYAS